MTSNVDKSVEQKDVKLDQWDNSAWFRFLFITLLVLGIYFRLCGLGNKIYSHDESYTSMYAAGYRGGFVFTSLWDGKTKTTEDIQSFLKPGNDRGVSEVIQLLAYYSPHQVPLFFVMEHLWMKTFGSMPEATRALAALFGLLSIPSIYWLSMELFQSSRQAFVSAMLFSISPFHILFSQDARPYSLWTLATLLSCAALLRASRINRPIAWATYSTTLIFGMYSHQLFALVAIVHVFYLAVTQIGKNRNGIKGFILAGIFSFAAYIPWLYFVISRWQQAAGQVEVLKIWIPWYRYIQRWALLFSSPIMDLDLNSDYANLALYFLRALTLILIASSILYMLRNAPRHVSVFVILIYIITAGTFMALDLFLGGIRSITGRYFVPANIATILVVAYFLTEKSDLWRGRSRFNWRLGLGLLMLGAVLSNINSLLSETWWNKELGRVRAEFVHEIDRDGTLLVVTGRHPTNLGDVLLLGFEVDSDIQFRLFQNPEDTDISGDYDQVYWFPSSFEEVTKVSEQRGIETREVIQSILWYIESKP